MSGFKITMMIPSAGALGAVVLIALAHVAPIQAHDFGGTTNSSAPESPNPTPPCNSCPCAGPQGGGGGGPGNSGGLPPSSMGDPISLFNGAQELAITDLVVNGVFPITIQRKYDSRSTYDSPLGYGWTFLQDRRLYEYADNSILVRHGCGTRDRYTPSGGAYVSPVGSMLATLTANAGGGHQLKYLNGVVDTFDSQGRLTSIADAQGNQHVLTYDSRGKLPLTGSSAQAVDPTQPMTVAYVYRLTRIDELDATGAATGHYVTFEYNESTGRVSSVTANDGRTVDYVQDTSGSLTKGNLVQVNGLEGIVSTYDYADSLDVHNLTTITPSQGHTPVVNTYDSQDRVTRQVEGTRQLDISYPTAYTKTVATATIKDHNGLNPYTAVSTYEFDTSGRVTKLTDALGHENRYTYNAAKMLTRKEIWEKSGSALSLLQSTDWTYDANGNKLTESVLMDSGERITRSWTYEQDWIASEQVVSSTAPTKLFRTEYTFYYGADGRPTNIESRRRRKDDGSFQTTTYSYDSRNRLVTTTLPDGVQRVKEYTGDYVTRTYFAVNGSALPQMQRRFEYDAQGDLIKQWDGRSNLTQHVYDDRRRLVATTNGLGEEMHATFAQARLSQIEFGRTVSEGEGLVSRPIYDSRDRIVGVQRKNDAGAWITFKTFQLDSEGRRLSITDAENRTTFMAYDLLGRITSATDSLGKSALFTYDAASNRVMTTDALGRQTRYEYDDLNRVTAVVELGIAPNARLEYAYDAMGNLVSVQDPEGHVTTYIFDALSRNTRVTQPSGQFVQYVYDDRDRVDYVVNARGNKVDYDYESWGDVTSERRYATTSAVVADRTITYTYDNDGNVVSSTDSELQANPAYTIAYDALGRRYDEVIRYIPGGNRTLSHRYNRYGNRKELTLQDSGAFTNTYVYNKLNQLSTANLGGAAISVANFANDDWQTITLPNGVSEQFVYRTDGPVQSISIDGPAGQLAQFAYTYDDALNVDTQTDQYGVHDFNYDALNRLTQVIRPNSSGLPNESYGYDGVGNREDPSNSALYSYDNDNRITSSPSLTYTFDADGNMQGRSDGAAFTHDPTNRLTQFVKAGTTANYVYDSRGRRIKKTVNTTDTWYLWDGSSLLAEYNAGGSRTKRYAYLPRRHTPLQVHDVNGAYYIHLDHLQTPRLLTGSAGQIVWRARYEAFGQAVLEQDADGNLADVELNLRFPGQYFDSESGLHYNYMRDYDPRTGRYVQDDPLGLSGGINLYAYAGGNPINTMDPFGLWPVCWDTPWGSKPNTDYWEDKNEFSWYDYKLRVGWPSVGDSLDPRKFGQVPVWPSSPVELWKVEYGITMITTGVTTSITDTIKVQCTDEYTDECGNKKERYDSWEKERVHSVNVKVLTQDIDVWMRWIEKVVKIIDAPWPMP